MGLVDTTTYRVETQMVAKDEASVAFRAITQSANVATGAIERLKQGIGLLGIGLGFHAAKEKLVDFNAELEDSRVVMAGMLTMFTGASIEKSWDRAGQSVETFNKMAAKSSLTTKDLVNLSSMIERPLLQAGVRMNDIEKITFGAANAAKAFGISPEVASMDIQQALSTGVHIKDRFMMSLLAQKEIGYTPEKFNALNSAGRIKVMQQSTETKAIIAMAKKQGEDTFHGVTSTLEDNMSLMFGGIGLNLFREVTHEVQDWNTWLDKNSLALEKMGRTLSQSLVSGFRYVKDVFQFLYDHGDTLLTLGKVWAAVKVGGMLSGGVGFGKGNLSAVMGAAGGATSSVVGAVGSMFRSAILSVGIRAPELIRPMTAIANFSSKLAGRVGNIASGLGGAAGGLGIGGIVGIGYAAHELGEYLGVHKALTQAIDPTRARLMNLSSSMEIFDDALKKTAKDLDSEQGGLGTVSAKNALGAVNFMKTQLNVLTDIQAGRYKGADADAAMAKRGYGYNAAARAKLSSAGFDDDEIKRMHLDTAPGRLSAISSISARMSSVGKTAYAASHETDMGIDAAMKLMSVDQRASIDMKKATQIVMEKFMQLFSSSGYGMTGLNAALMSPEEIKKLLLKDSLDPFKGANINQNITNNIKVEVASKDPDRWLREVDEKVQRKIRAPSQARGSIITRGGL